MAEIKNTILAGLFFGITMGIVFGLMYGKEYGLISGIISGVAFGSVIYLFVKSKVVRQQTQIENNEGQKIIHSGGANHFVNSKAVGGKLYLLANEIKFKSHNYNVQNHNQTIPLEQVKEIGFFNTLGLVPNGLSITTNYGIEKYVVNNRRIWKEKIENQKLNNSTNRQQGVE